MGEPGSPRGLCAGWQAQGKKVSLPPLRFRRSRRSRPSARSSQSEARCSRALNSIWETCQLAIGPRKRSRIPGEGKENMARRKAPLVLETDRTPRAGRVTAGSKSRWRSPVSSEARDGPMRSPVMRKTGDCADPNRTDDGAVESPRRDHRRPLAGEVGPAQHHLWRSGVCPLRPAPRL